MKRPRVLAAAAVLLAAIAFLSIMVVAPGVNQTWSVYLLRAVSLAAGFLLMVVLAVTIPPFVRKDRSYHPRARAQA